MPTAPVPPAPPAAAPIPPAPPAETAPHQAPTNHKGSRPFPRITRGSKSKAPKGNVPAPVRVTPDPSGQARPFPPAPRTVSEATPPAGPSAYKPDDQAPRAKAWPADGDASSPEGNVGHSQHDEHHDGASASYLATQAPSVSAQVGESLTSTANPEPRSRPTLLIMGAVAALTLLIGGFFVLRGGGNGSETAGGPQPDGQAPEANASSTPETEQPPNADPGSDPSSSTDTSVTPSTSDTSAAPTSAAATTETTSAPASTTEQPAPTSAAPAPTQAPATRNGAIIGELARPVRMYSSNAFSSEVITELGVGAPLEIQQRDKGWYQVSTNGSTGWIFGAFVTPAAEGFANFISIDGTLLEPRTKAGEPIAGTYRGGKYAFGRRAPVNGLIEIFLPSGRMATVEANAVREIRR